MVYDQWDGSGACYARGLFRGFLRAVTLDMPVSLAKVAKTSAFVFIFGAVGVASCGDRV